jgi:NADH-quinone oxidoreductase subunit C
MSELGALLEGAIPGAVLEEIEFRGELTLVIAPELLPEVARRLRDDPLGFTLLSDVTCADFPDEPGRFRVAYHLYSFDSGRRVRLRAWAGAERPSLPTVTGVWPTADWHEREVWDMFGVRFEGHPDLSRILMPADWDGHPLRRDYPLGGEEVRFSDAV